MICPVCGETLPADAFFCGACGSAVGTRDERDAAPRRRAEQPPAPPTAEQAAPAAEQAAPAAEQTPPAAVLHVPQPVPQPAGAPDDRETAVAAPTVLPAGVPAVGPTGIPTAAPSVPLPGLGAPLAPEELTRLPAAVPRPTVTRFVLVFSTGEHVVVEGSGLIGRRPQPQPGEVFDALVTIDDPGRSVSKTHVEFGQDGGSFWVSDRYSANGTVVREPDRPARLCAPGMRSRVARGSRVEIGEQFFVVS